MFREELAECSSKIVCYEHVWQPIAETGAIEVRIFIFKSDLMNLRYAPALTE